MSASTGSDRRLVVEVVGEREIVMTRVFRAPQRLVFDAMTRADQVPLWFGPRGFTVPVCEIDLRVGGAWRYVLRGPDGRQMGMRGVYREIAAPDRLVWTESFDDFPGEALNTMTLVEKSRLTTVTIHILSSSGKARDAVIASGMERGAGETYDRLDELLSPQK